jgi:hypothetical protein
LRIAHFGITSNETFQDCDCVRHCVYTFQWLCG